MILHKYCMCAVGIAHGNTSTDMYKHGESISGHPKCKGLCNSNKFITG